MGGALTTSCSTGSSVCTSGSLPVRYCTSRMRRSWRYWLAGSAKKFTLAFIIRVDTRSCAANACLSRAAVAVCRSTGAGQSGHTLANPGRPLARSR